MEAAGAAKKVAKVTLGVLEGADRVLTIVDSAKRRSHRECTIELQNICTSYSLCHPRTLFVSGGCATPPSPSIAPLTSSVFKFIKTLGPARGSVGVFTYDLLHKNAKHAVRKIAVMYSVPFDFNLYSNWYAVGIFDRSKKCDYELYRQMYYDPETSFRRGKARDGCLVYEGDDVTIEATMSNNCQSVMKVHVTDVKR